MSKISEKTYKIDSQEMIDEMVANEMKWTLKTDIHDDHVIVMGMTLKGDFIKFKRPYDLEKNKTGYWRFQWLNKQNFELLKAWKTRIQQRLKLC